MNNRQYSKEQEERIAKKFGVFRQPNSGATKWKKGDIYLKDLDLLIECKTTTKEQSSFRIKKDWISKLREEKCLYRGNPNHIALAIDFGDREDYYLVNNIYMEELLSIYKEVKE